jgi:hypothetical protein
MGIGYLPPDRPHHLYAAYDSPESSHSLAKNLKYGRSMAFLERGYAALLYERTTGYTRAE